jgi:hypothetical protein
MNREHVYQELRIIRQNMNTNNQQINTTYIVDDITYDLYNDIIIVVGSGW